MVLLAIVHLGGESYAVPIVDEIERRTGRSVSRAAVYITLRRLEEKRLLSSWLGDSTPERGGKARRHVKLEAEGARAASGTADGRADVARCQCRDVVDALTRSMRPPRLATSLLRRVLPEDVRDAIDGDLRELYLRRRSSSPD